MRRAYRMGKVEEHRFEMRTHVLSNTVLLSSRFSYVRSFDQLSFFTFTAPTVRPVPLYLHRFSIPVQIKYSGFGQKWPNMHILTNLF